MTIQTTLLDLVASVGRYTDTEEELVAVVVHLVNSGAATLIGNFKGIRSISRCWRRSPDGVTGGREMTNLELLATELGGK